MTALTAWLLAAVSAEAAPIPGYAVPSRSLTPVGPWHRPCTVLAPTTTAGYAAMFTRLLPSQWGAADVSISIPLPDGRAVWLYGDTLVVRGGVTGMSAHSTAITQDRGCLHVSNQGAQLLPSDDPQHYYWISSAAADSSTRLRVTADRVEFFGPGAWDFRTVGVRTATVAVDDVGDLTFLYWTDLPPVPAQRIVVKDGGAYAPWSSTVSMAGRVVIDGLPHTGQHFSYAASAHPEARLASGRLLVTVCQNGFPADLATYRPMFFEVQ